MTEFTVDGMLSRLGDMLEILQNDKDGCKEGKVCDNECRYFKACDLIGNAYCEIEEIGGD